MSRYSSLYNPNVTPQNEPAPGKNQVQNSAGGYAFNITPLQRLERFLILGSDAPTYYTSAQKLTRQNAENVVKLWETDPKGTAETIVNISKEGRAARNDPAIFALALGAASTNPEARRAAYDAVQDVCRISTHLFQWITYCKDLGKGMGRGWRAVLAKWYASRKTEALAYQAIKYRQRANMTHKRAIQMSDRGPFRDAIEQDASRKALYDWICGREKSETPKGLRPAFVSAHLEAMASQDPKLWVKLVKEHNLPWEALPTEALRVPEVWEAMLPNMGLTALIRNLGNMTEVGTLAPMGGNVGTVIDRLRDESALHKARIHPFNVLNALKTYSSGRGFRGSKTWTPNQKIVGALNEAFYKSFKNVTPTNKRIMLALDVSGSMSSELMNSNISAREAAACMAMVTEKVEPNVATFMFTTTFKPANISGHQRLDDIVRYMAGQSFGGTDCSLPMTYAQAKDLKVDTFIVYTDSETWYGGIHPYQALLQYRRYMGIPAKLIVVGLTSTGFSIADPDDAGMLDIVGFDANGPALISDFISR